ncbi:MAG: hypothetical protein WD624_05275 [Rhodospirillales bacterium]
MRQYRLIGIAAFIFAAAALPAQAELAEGKRDGIYQIVKATDTRVWRLNTVTGEIAVCELAGSNLVCTTTANAAEVPKKSYAEIEAGKEAAAAEEQARRDQELKFLDKILALFRELLATAMGQSQGS